MADRTNPHRQRAYKLRRALKAGQTLAPADQLWLAEYDEAQQKGDGIHRLVEEVAGPEAAANIGASESGRRVKIDVQESARSVGVGSAAEAAAHAAAAREEGRRLDSLTINAVGALKAAVDTYKAICESMAQRMETLEATHVSMLDAVRDHFIARTEAEVQLREAQNSDDGANGMLMALIAQHLGIPVPAAPAARAPARPNGPPK